MGTADWQEKADWMRAVGATSATWGDDGQKLVSLALGPAPVPPSDDDDAPMGRVSIRRTPAELKRIALGASGGPVPTGAMNRGGG